MLRFFLFLTQVAALGGTPPPVTDSFFLLEDGSSFLLLEDGSKLVLE